MQQPDMIGFEGLPSLPQLLKDIVDAGQDDWRALAWVADFMVKNAIGDTVKQLEVKVPDMRVVYRDGKRR